MNRKKFLVWMLIAVLAVSSVFSATAVFAEEESDGDSGSSEAAEGARTADEVQNNRCYINGDEIRAFQSDDGIYVVADDLVSYGFQVAAAENGLQIDWAGTDYYIAEYTPNTDQDGMVACEVEDIGETALLNGTEIPVYQAEGMAVVKAEDLGALGFYEFDDAKNMANIYIAAAGYEENEAGYRNVTVDAANVIGTIENKNGAHFDPGAPGTETNQEYQDCGIVSMRTHDIGLDAGSLGTIYTICPGYFNLHGILKFVPAFQEDLTAAATEAGKLEGTGEMPGEDWAANARLEDLEENAWAGTPADPQRTNKIQEILDKDAYLTAMDEMNALVEETKAALDGFDVSADECYDFEGLDAVIDNFLSIGANVYFRFGAASADIVDNTFPEIGTEEWETFRTNLGIIAVKICDHYMNSEKYQNALGFFEIWNEPDLLDFWPNTPQHYYEMYDAVSRAVKAAYPELPVGGPTITTENDDRGTKESFLEYVVANDCPLDFYSYHFYPSNNLDAYDYSRFAYEYEALLKEYGFEDIPLVISEYGTALFSQFTGFANQKNRAAIHLLNNYIYLADTAVEYNYTWNRVGNPKDGQDLALKAIHKLHDTADRLAVTGGDKNGFAVMAGKNDDSIRVIISNYEVPAEQMLRNYPPENPNPMMDGNKFSIPDVANWSLPVARVLTYKNNQGYNLTISNVPFTGEVTVEVYKIDAEHYLDAQEAFTVPVAEDGSITISADLPVYSADVLVITQ